MLALPLARRFAVLLAPLMNETMAPDDTHGADQCGPPPDAGEAAMPFTRAELLAECLTPLNLGRWGNADLHLFQRNGETWVIKDFSRRLLPVRHLLGRPFVRREVRALRRLQGLAGVPQGCFRLDRFALCYRFVPGRTLREIERNGVGREFFLELESVIQAMHQRGVVHLDVRYRRNVLVAEAGGPVLLDFQTSLVLDSVPRFAWSLLKKVDLSAVDKLWWKRSPDSFEAERHARLRRYSRLRRLWIFAGYVVSTRSIRHFFHRLAKNKDKAPK